MKQGVKIKLEENISLAEFEQNLIEAFDSFLRLNKQINAQREDQWMPTKEAILIKIYHDVPFNTSELIFTTIRPEFVHESN